MQKRTANGNGASSRGVFFNTGNGPMLQCIDIGDPTYAGIIDPDAAF